MVVALTQTGQDKPKANSHLDIEIFTCDFDAQEKLNFHERLGLTPNVYQSEE